MSPPTRVALMAPCSDRFIRDLADGLVADGYEVTLLTAHGGLPKVEVEEGLRVVRLPRAPEGQLARRRFEEHLTHAPFIALALRAGGFDIAQAVHPTDGAVAARWSRATGRPSIFSFQGIPHRAWLTQRRMRLKLTVEAAQGCDVVVASSRAAADEFHRTLGIEARVIPPERTVEAYEDLYSELLSR